MHPSTWKSHQTHINRNKNTAGDKAALLLLLHSWHRPCSLPTAWLPCVRNSNWASTAETSPSFTLKMLQRSQPYKAILTEVILLPCLLKKKTTIHKQTGSLCKPLWQTGSSASLQSKYPHFHVCTCSPRLLSVSTGKTLKKNRAFQNHYHKNEICFFPSCSLKQVSNPGQAPDTFWCIKWTEREEKQPQCLWLTAEPTLLSPTPAKLVLTVLPLFNNTFEDYHKPAFSFLIRAKTCVGASL